MKTNLFWTLIHKEWTEQLRSGRLVILLAVFLFFGISSPLLAKFIPDILPSLMKGQNIILHIPPATWQDAIAQFVKNLSQMGLFVVILLSMGSVAKEKENGTASFLLVKPVSRNLFILSKFSAQLLVLFVSMLVGFLAMVFYTKVFFGTFPMVPIVETTLVLFLYLTVIQSVTILFSVLMKTQITAGLLAFITSLVFSGVSMLGKPGLFSPGHLLDEIQTCLNGSPMDWQPFAGSLIILFCCVGISLRFFRDWEN